MQNEVQTKKELTKISLGELEPCAVSAHKFDQMKNMVCTHRDALYFYIWFCSAATYVEFDENSKKNNFPKGREINLFNKILHSKTYT